MDFMGKVAAITGGAGGIGAALARALHARGAKVAACDLDGAAAEKTGAACGGFGMAADVSNEADVARFINAVERRLGPIDLYFSNAGVGFSDGPLWGAADAPNRVWETQWAVNVMASVYAARLVAPKMAARGAGAFVITASAAGVLHQIGDTAYSATKSAAVALAEGLAIAYGDAGVQVHCLCPQYVRTGMTKDLAAEMTGVDGMISAEEAAETTLKALEDNRFLILTHAVTGEHFMRKAGDRDRWLKGMRGLRAMLVEKLGRPF